MYSSTPLVVDQISWYLVLLPSSTQSTPSWFVSIAITNKVWVKKTLFEMIWPIQQCSAVYNCLIISMTFFRVPYFSAIFPCLFFNFSCKVKLKSRLLEISFLIPALCCELQRTNVSSPRWHSFVSLIFPGPHSPIFIDCTSTEHHVIFLFWQNFPLKRFALWSLKRALSRC